MKSNVSDKQRASIKRLSNRGLNAPQTAAKLGLRMKVGLA
jgi:hypothetical protein